MTIQEIVRFWEMELRLPYSLSNEELLRFWDAVGKPYSNRVHAVQEYSRKFGIRNLVETGTYHGDMVQSMINNFDRIISVELSDELYQAAKDKFSPYPHVTIVHGDSGKELGKILESISDPCLFWLDGHFTYMFGDSARGDLDTPIIQELEHIFRHPVRNHVILIDDARCFIGPNSILNHYPTIQELEHYVKSKRPELVFEVKDDIIRLH